MRPLVISTVYTRTKNIKPKFLLALSYKLMHIRKICITFSSEKLIYVSM
jgi:hypothetical protein